MTFTKIEEKTCHMERSKKLETDKKQRENRISSQGKIHEREKIRVRYFAFEDKEDYWRSQVEENYARSYEPKGRV